MEVVQREGRRGRGEKKRVRKEEESRRRERGEERKERNGDRNEQEGGEEKKQGGKGRRKGKKAAKVTLGVCECGTGRGVGDVERVREEKEGVNTIKARGGKKRVWEERRERGKEGTDEKRELKIGFWNVAGIKGMLTDGEWEEELKEWVAEKTIVGLVETWMRKEDWEEVRERLPKGFRWEMKEAIKTAVKGRARGGMIVGVKGGGQQSKVEFMDGENDVGW